jgi:quinol monooxygenase YgiN
MSMIAMVKMTVFPVKRQELLQTLETLHENTCRADSGCLGYSFYLEEGDENTIIMVMEWQSQEKLAEYQKTDSFKILQGAASLLCQDFELKIAAKPVESSQ